MQRLKNLVLASCTCMLLFISISGCAQKGYVQQGHAQNVDCRSCHTLNSAAGAGDFSHIYANPSSHHPVGIKYPADPNAKPNFKQSNSYAGTGFFDRNGNGKPDSDEVQLFGANGEATVECASCHKEHWNASPAASATRNHYLRLDNAGSALCTTCHSY